VTHLMGADYRILLPEYSSIAAILISKAQSNRLRPLANPSSFLLRARENSAAQRLGIFVVLIRAPLHLRLVTNRGNYRPPPGTTQYCWSQEAILKSTSS